MLTMLTLTLTFIHNRIVKKKWKKILCRLNILIYLLYVNIEINNIKNMEKKFEVIDTSIEFNGHQLYRIKALKDFADVKFGDFGGWVEVPQNLSQEGDCWIYDNAKVIDVAQVKDNAQVRDNAIVKSNALVCGDAVVEEDALVGDFAIISNHTGLRQKVKAVGQTTLFTDATIMGTGTITGSVIINCNK